MLSTGADERAYQRANSIDQQGHSTSAALPVLPWGLPVWVWNVPGDSVQPPLRSRFPPRLMPGVRQLLEQDLCSISPWEGSVVQVQSRKHHRSPKWMLFVALLLTMPVPYFMLVVGGIVPTLCLISLAVHGLFVAVPKLTAEGFWMLGILWGHVVILGGLLYGVAVSLTWFLFRVMPARYALLMTMALIISLFVVSSFEIYRVPGHHHAPPANLRHILHECAPSQWR
jgi:hypothetical protein